HAQQYFQFTLLAQSPLRIGVSSEYLFRATDNEALRWQVQAGGETFAEGQVKLELSPEGQSELTLCDALALPVGAEAVWLTLEVVQPKATAWSDAGHRVAWQQFPLAAPLALRRPSPVGTAPALESSDAAWTVRSGSQQWTIDRESGLLTHWQVEGVEQLL
ncbi:beta-galactosidase domain 4-containing protein, partial [Klebsiella michiganensis]